MSDFDPVWNGGQYAGMSAILTFTWSTDRNALVNTVRNQMVNGDRNLQYSALIGKNYIGHTDCSMEERLERHLNEHSGFTSKAKDWIVVFQREFMTKQEAYEFEREIKSWKSRRRIQQLIDQYKLS